MINIGMLKDNLFEIRLKYVFKFRRKIPNWTLKLDLNVFIFHKYLFLGLTYFFITNSLLSFSLVSGFFTHYTIMVSKTLFM